jgi:hypothetical protein
MRRALSSVVAIAALALVPAGAGAKPEHGPVMLTCGAPGPAFAPLAFHNPTGAESAATPQAQALRDLFRSTREAGFPPFPETGWRALAETADRVIFHHGRPDSGTALTFALVDGRWRWAASGCSARRVIPGYAVSPILTPGPEPLRRNARRIVLTVAEGTGCQRDEFERFAVRETRHRRTSPAQPCSTPRANRCASCARSGAARSATRASSP